jgi:hypothetical protein
MTDDNYMTDRRHLAAARANPLPKRETMSETRRKRTERFSKKNRLVSARNRRRQFINTPFGNRLTGDFVELLATFFAGGYAEQPDDPPRFLRKQIRELNDPYFLALAALAPLLDGIFRGWDRNDLSAGTKLKLRVGKDLCRRLSRVDPEHKPFSERQCLGAGNWLLRQALALDIFDYDEDGLPRISDKWRPHVAQLRQRMIAADPSFAPRLRPPSPWTGSTKTYDDGFQAQFVRDWRPQTKAAIEAAFLNGDFEHARGVSLLAQVALKIDHVMVDLVERLTVDLMGNEGRQREADQVTVAADVADAKWCVDHGAFWLDHNCDKRGRVYALQHFNFARADHARSLFRFEHGLSINGDTRWLEIHAANCEGSTDKKSRDERVKWVGEHREDVKRIAKDPDGTFDKIVLGGKGWKKADSPFCFVAACRELAAAWADPENFITHLPIGFDGSANGLQHLALLVKDLKAAAMVNLTGDDDPSDVYGIVIDNAVELIEADPSDHAAFWRERFEVLDRKQKRKLLKQPIMTFAYSVTPAGAALQINKVYRSFRQNAKPPEGAFGYLARKVLEACKIVLPGPARVMHYIRDLAKHCADQGRFLEWVSPTGFPVSNRYQVPKTIIVDCTSGGVRVQHKIADGITDQIDLAKTLAAASPNLIHSLDAAHLIKVVNAAVSEGITDILTVHDCFYCLAPQASRMHEIIMEQLADMYSAHDPLSELRARNVGDQDVLPVPPKGDMLELEFKPGGWMLRYIKRAKILTRYRVQQLLSLEQVKKSKNAFG